MDSARRRRRMGRGRDLPLRDGRTRLQSRTPAALHRHRPGRRQHRARAQGVRGGARLAAVRSGISALRPQPGRGRRTRRPDAVAIPAHRRPVDVLRHGPDGVAAGAHQAGAATAVGSADQQHLHVVLRVAVRGRRGALAAQPHRVGGVRPPVHGFVVRRARGVRAAARRAAVGRSELHSCRRRRWSGQPAVHVPRPRGRSRRRTARRDAHEPAGRPPVRGAHLHPRLGDAASPVGRRAARLRAGQREPGGGDSLAARGGDRDDLDLPVAPGQARLASAVGGLPVGDGFRAGVLRRALRRRHPAGLGAGRRGLGGDEPRRLVVVAAPRGEISPTG